MRDESRSLSEREFSFLVESALPRIFDIQSIEREPRLLSRGRPDFIALLRDGRRAIIEIKIVTPATTTRLEKAAIQLRSYGEAYVEAAGGRSPMLVLVVSGSIPPDRVQQLMREGVDHVVDGLALRAAAPTLAWPDSVGDRPILPRMSASEALSTELGGIAPGRPEWVAYQRVVRDILALTLTPPLEQPLDERANWSGVNRRDIILPNYANEGPWRFLREHYDAHYVVVDAKNYRGGVKKKDILQIANYLSAHGAGLFGMIVCRDAVDRSAEITRREQWVIYRKLVIVLNDADLRTMLSLAAAQADPSTVIRQKIEDFRLGF